MVIGFFIDSLSNYQSSRYRTTYGLVNIFTLIETIWLMVFFQYIFKKKVLTIIIISSGILFFIFWLIMFIRHGNNKYMELLTAYEALAIIVLSVYYFYVQLKKSENSFLYLHHTFWIVSAYLIYTAGTFFLFLFQNSLTHEDQKNYFLLNSIFIIIKTALITVGMITKNANKNNNNKIPTYINDRAFT